jgi:hypothetical protein
MKHDEHVYEPPGAVTVIPWLALLGTLVTIVVRVEDVTVAAALPNLTEFWLGVVLKLSP